MPVLRGAMIALILALLIPFTQSARAEQPLPAPHGPILLTVTGAIEITNSEKAARFDLNLLQTLPQVEYRTSTIWTDGEKVFAGVPLSALLKRLGVSSGRLKARAINDYTVEIPIDSLQDNAPMIAFSMDGAPMSRRDKGPLWIVYPYDSDPSFRTEVNFSRSIWQLDRIEVVLE